MIVKEIIIDEKKVKFAASASIPRIYRIKFNRDIIIDMKKLSDDIQNDGSNDDKEESTIPIESLTIFENVAYIMAKHADNSIPDNVYDWLDKFETFSIYTVLPELLELWRLNTSTMSTPKKK